MVMAMATVDAATLAGGGEGLRKTEQRRPTKYKKNLNPFHTQRALSAHFDFDRP
jgi:hypothetical protein